VEKMLAQIKIRYPQGFLGGIAERLYHEDILFVLFLRSFSLSRPSPQTSWQLVCHYIVNPRGAHNAARDRFLGAVRKEGLFLLPLSWKHKKARGFRAKRFKGICRLFLSVIYAGTPCFFELPLMYFGQFAFGKQIENADSEPAGIIIRSREIAVFFRSLFAIAWQGARRPA
jgi:hypothetical protein